MFFGSLLVILLLLLVQLRSRVSPTPVLSSLTTGGGARRGLMSRVGTDETRVDFARIGFVSFRSRSDGRTTLVHCELEDLDSERLESLQRALSLSGEDFSPIEVRELDLVVPREFVSHIELLSGSEVRFSVVPPRIAEPAPTSPDSRRTLSLRSERETPELVEIRGGVDGRGGEHQ
jgi:hypothetical protein